MSAIEVGAYFYPLNRTCPIKTARAESLGYTPVDETLLVQQAQPYFSEHDQPRTYTLGSPTLTTWDDSSPDAMARQVELAKEAGLSFFVFDTYMGIKNGQFIHESAAPLDQAFLGLRSAKDFQFALMVTKGSPRAILPVPPGESLDEPGRNYDLTPASARAIVDKCASHYWSQPNYLLIKNRPYLSLWLPDFSQSPSTQVQVKDYVHELEAYAWKEYGIELYLVAAIKQIEQVASHLEIFLTRLTAYAFLADFGKTGEPVQFYDQQVEKRKREWTAIQQQGAQFIPPAVIGWDGSPRGELGHTWEQVQGIYPYTPIVMESTPAAFQSMLMDTISFIKETIPVDEQYALICAWNEISEGSSLLPRLFGDFVDCSYLQAVKEVVESL